MGERRSALGFRRADRQPGAQGRAGDERDGDGVTVSIREWVGLTDEEIENLWEMAQAWNAPKHFYILISAKLKEKNSG